MIFDIFSVVLYSLGVILQHGLSTVQLYYFYEMFAGDSTTKSLPLLHKQQATKQDWHFSAIAVGTRPSRSSH
jgi:hypothetical protein